MARQLAEQLRPELEAAVKRNDSAPGEAYSPDAASVRAGCCHLVHQLGLRLVSTNWHRTSQVFISNWLRLYACPARHHLMMPP